MTEDYNEDKEDERLTLEEQEELAKVLGGAPSPEEKHSIFQFFNKILKTGDTKKVSNLDNNELFSVRILLNTADYASLMGLGDITTYLNREAETTLATADSKTGFLIKAAITSRKDVKIGEGTEKKKSGWGGFGKKGESQQGGGI